MALKQRGFHRTLECDATTTMAVLSSIAHPSRHYSTMSDLKPDLESDHVVQINSSQSSDHITFDENLL